MRRRAPPFVAAGAAGAAGERWTPQQAAEYAAARDYQLLKLLSKDRRATATAQRLGVFQRARHEECTVMHATERRRRDGAGAGKESGKATLDTEKGDVARPKTPRRLTEARKAKVDQKWRDKCKRRDLQKVAALHIVGQWVQRQAPQQSTAPPPLPLPDAATVEALRSELAEARASEGKLRAAATHWKRAHDMLRQEQQQTEQQPQQGQRQRQQQQQQAQQLPKFPASPSAEAMDTEQNALLNTVAPKRATEGQAGRPIEPKKTRSSRDGDAGGGDRGRG